MLKSMKQRSQGSRAEADTPQGSFNGTDTDTAKSEPEKSALYLLKKGEQGRYGDNENPHSIGCEGFRGFTSYLKE